MDSPKGIVGSFGGSFLYLRLKQFISNNLINKIYMKNLTFKNFKLTNDIKISKKTRNILIGLFGFIAIIVIGNYHIVLNATDPLRAFIFIKRPYFGLSDILGDINACTGTPYYIAISNHPSLCKALQNAGYLESDNTRTQRIETETAEQLQEFNNQNEELQKYINQLNQ